MFAKLKKKVEDLEGTDLHKLANSISFGSSLGSEKTPSHSSVRSSDLPGASQSLRGSTTSLSSMQGATKTDETEQLQAIEKKWSQKLTDVENEWRVKVMVHEHEKEQLAKERDSLNQQKRKLEEELKLLKSFKEKSLEVEENLQQQQNSKNKEISSLQLLLSNACVEVEDAKAKEDTLRKELMQKDQIIDMLRSQLGLTSSNGERDQPSSLSVDEQERSESTSAAERLVDAQRLTAIAQEEAESYRQSLVRKQEEFENLQKQFNQLKASFDNLSQNWQDEKSHSLLLKEKLAQLTEETNKLALRNAQLSQQTDLSQQQYQRLEKEAEEVQKRCEKLEEENENVKRLLSDAEARDENSEKMRNIREQLAELESSVSEKNKTIKLQQQRLADMKKMLQKELKNQTTNDSDNNASQSFPSPSVNRKNPAATSAVPPAKSELEDVNFKYLKHVIFKFLTSREYEAQHLTRAVSTLLKLTPDEEKLLKETLEWKMSWFRAKPDLGSGQSALYIPPTH